MSVAPKYFVEHRGKTMTLGEYAELTGLNVSTLRKRALDGRPVSQPGDMERGARRRAVLKAGQVSRFKNGYTYDELTELYPHFAGSEDELRMLQDFTGLGHAAAQRLLEKLKHHRREN